ncbi:MAG: T9SS type A sorting domain-containing protein [Bacteroidales bacterium]
MLALVYIKVIQAQYISEVLEYKPAPGQLINASPWGIPGSAKSIVGTVSGSMSLGAFGGYVIFTFKDPVVNHPDNPFGVDFTIFGNSLNDWFEPGIVSVMKDENGNGLPDDTWYELAGSEYFFSTTVKNYQVTYTNPGLTVAADVEWTDNLGASGFVLKNSFHSQPYYPSPDSFPAINPAQYTLTGTRIASELDRTNPAFIKSYRKAFGYADNQWRGSAPYTIPDNPYTPEMENSGGDAFDISWAVNEYGAYVDLDVIHFVKVHNAVLANTGWLGELSTEITGAVDVAPDNSITGIDDILVLKHLPDTIIGNTCQIEVFAFDKGRRDKDAVINWSVNLSHANINAQNLLTFSSSGKLIITAYLAKNSAITATDSAVLIYQDNSTSLNQNRWKEIRVHPNPASESIYIEGLDNAAIRIFDITGKIMLVHEKYSGNEAVPVSHLPKGVYIVILSGKTESKTMRLIKN